MQSEDKGLLLGLVGVFLFSLTLPLTKIALDGFNPIFIGSARTALAGIIAIVFIFTKKVPYPKSIKFKEFLFMIPGIGFIYPIFTALALSNKLPSHAGVILGILPLATAYFSFIYAGEKPSYRFWLASIAGSLLVIGFALMDGTGSISYGDCLLFVACLAAAFAYAVGGTLSKEVKPIAIISWTLIYCLPANIVISYYSIDFRPFEVSINSWLAFIWLGISSSYLAFFFWYGGLSYGGVARVSQLLLLQPAFNLFLSYILLNDPLTALNLVFTFLIVLTVFIGKNQEILKA